MIPIAWVCITLAGHHFGVPGWCGNHEENIGTTLRRDLALEGVVALPYKVGQPWAALMAAPHGGMGGLGLGIGVHPQAQSPTLQPSSSTF